MSLQITVFLAVHAKTLREILQISYPLHWRSSSSCSGILVLCLRSLTFVTSPSGNLYVQETWQSWSWHSRVNTFSLERNQQGRGSCGQFSDGSPDGLNALSGRCKRKDHRTPTARNIVSVQIWTRMTAASLSLRVICSWFQL